MYRKAEVILKKKIFAPTPSEGTGTALLQDITRELGVGGGATWGGYKMPMRFQTHKKKPNVSCQHSRRRPTWPSRAIHASSLL
jgi:hypothetical protein